MAALLATWLMSALSVMILAWLLPGIHVSGFGGALVAALAIGLVNSLVKPFLQLITLPITILTLGLFWLILNGICLAIADFRLSAPSCSPSSAAWFSASSSKPARLEFLVNYPAPTAPPTSPLAGGREAETSCPPMEPPNLPASGLPVRTLFRLGEQQRRLPLGSTAR
ncbi:phage holin family protein [Thermostichus sp. MS-CIW-22]